MFTVSSLPLFPAYLLWGYSGFYSSEYNLMGRWKMTNQPRQFKHADVVRAFKAAEAAGVSNPTVQIRCRDGTEITVGGKPDEPALAIGKQVKAAPIKPKTFRPTVTEKRR